MSQSFEQKENRKEVSSLSKDCSLKPGIVLTRLYFQQNDLKRKLEQLKSENSKTRKKFEETLRKVKEERREAEIRRSRDALNKSTKTKRATKKKSASKQKTPPKPQDDENSSLSLSSEDDTTKKSTTEEPKRAKRKKAATKKKTAPTPVANENTSSSSSSEDETTKKKTTGEKTKKVTSKKTASDKTASKKSATKKKTALEPNGVIDTTSLPSEDSHEDPGGATIKKHSYDKEKELYTVLVSWKKSKKWKKVEWQFLHDMWVDYPEEVKTYRDLHRLKASAWKVPNIEDAAFVVRILSMNGPTPLSATFSILFDNGYVEKEADYANVCSDASDLLTRFLQERE